MRQRQRLRSTRILSSLILFTFTLTNTLQAAPAAISTPEVVSVTRSTAVGIVIPPSLGSIKVQSKPQGTVTLFQEAPFIIHIEDAHAQYQAQTHIAEILHYLHEQYGFDTLFLEGGMGELHPENLQFYAHPDQNRDVVNRLAQKGIVSGAELFLLDNFMSSSSSPVKAFGIEESNLYQENLKAYRDVLDEKAVTRQFLETYKLKLITLASKVFDSDLKFFFRDWLIFEDTQSQWMRHLKTLQDFAFKKLGIVLTNEELQWDWPQLVRFFKLQQMESELKEKQAKDEQTKLVTWMTEQDFDVSLIAEMSELGQKADSRISDLREWIEQFYLDAHPQGFSFEQYPEFSKLLGVLILRSELNAQELQSEIERLSSMIIDELTEIDSEKKLLRLFEDYLLLKKLFSLELVHDEYEAIVLNDSIAPSTMFERLKSITSQRQLEKNENLQKVDGVFDRAMTFYKLAQEREKVMHESMTQKMKELGLSKAVIITGGFHSKGLLALLESHKQAFVEITPKMNQLDDPSIYQNILTLKQNKTPARSELKAILPIVGLSEIKGLDEGTARLYQQAIKEAIARSDPNGPAASLNRLPRQKRGGFEVPGIPLVGVEKSGVPRSETREKAKLSPDEVTDHRALEFSAVRKQLLELFEIKKKSEIPNTEIIRRVQTFIPFVDKRIQEVRSLDETEQLLLNEIATKVKSEQPGIDDELKNQADALDDEIRAFRSKFIAANKKKDVQELTELNRTAVNLLKRRLKVQLVRLRRVLSAANEKVNQAPLFTLLMSVNLIYQRLTFEHSLQRVRDNSNQDKIFLLRVVDPTGSISDTYGYERDPYLRITEGNNGEKFVEQIVWKRVDVENGPEAVQPILTPMKFSDWHSAFRSKLHTLESQSVEYRQLRNHFYALEAIMEELKFYQSRPNYFTTDDEDDIVSAINRILEGPDGKRGLGRKVVALYKSGERVSADVRKGEVIPMPKGSLDAAKAYIANRDFKNAIPQVLSAQHYVGARIKYHTKLPVRGAERKLKYVYLLMRDFAVISALQELRGISSDFQEIATLEGNTTSDLKNRLSQIYDAIKGIEDTYFRFPVSTSFGGSDPAYEEVKYYERSGGLIAFYRNLLEGAIQDLKLNNANKALNTIKGVGKKIGSQPSKIERDLSQLENRIENRKGQLAPTRSSAPRSEIRQGLAVALADHFSEQAQPVLEAVRETAHIASDTLPVTLSGLLQGASDQFRAQLGIPSALATEEASVNIATILEQLALGNSLERYLSALKLQPKEVSFPLVRDISELTPDEASRLFVGLGTNVELLITDASPDQNQTQVELNRNYLLTLFPRQKVHFLTSGDSIVSVISNLGLGQDVPSVALFSRGVNPGFSSKSNFSVGVNGIMFRMDQQSVDRAGIKIQLSQYAIPLLRVVGTATRRQIPDILAKLQLTRDAEGEIVLGVGFLSQVAELLKAQQGEQALRISA